MVQWGYDQDGYNINGFNRSGLNKFGVHWSEWEMVMEYLCKEQEKILSENEMGDDDRDIERIREKQSNEEQYDYLHSKEYYDEMREYAQQEYEEDYEINSDNIIGDWIDWADEIINQDEIEDF